MRPLLLTLSLLILTVVLHGQDKRRLAAERISTELRIDGQLDESVWSTAAIADGFIENEPSPGQPSDYRTEVRVLYDDEAVYIGAMLYDSAPDSILRQLSQRDDFDNTDFFGVEFDCYRDGINGLEFIVTAAGVQMDVRYGQNSQDVAWNAVWWSAVEITSEGWQVELKIPFAALRFPESEEQLWHLNLVRSVRRSREKSFWNNIDPGVEGFFNQSGLLEGIRDIDPPVRLFFYPYLSAYAENNETNEAGWRGIFNGGMDVKYGINDAFTLDMTLIPDFGQVQSDNQVLNLSPFEVAFDERRQFFTEGTELFNKADLFFSRRIGGRPIDFSAGSDAVVEESETLVSNPSETRLLNAAKVSGRNSKGLGIGALNAVSARTDAVIRNEETGAQRTVTTSPLTNYNILVFDQNLWSNSYVSLVNTNVTRNGSTYDANVTGTEFRLSNKSNSASISGTGALSQKYYSDRTDLGHSYSMSIDKTGGPWNYGLEHSTISDTFDPNDLGLLFTNNERSFDGYIGHRQIKPSERYIRSRQFLYYGYSRRYAPDAFQNFYLNFEYFWLMKSFFAFGGSASLEPVVTYDYFEPRANGRYYAFPTNRNIGSWISSDYRKTFALDLRWNFRQFDDERRQRFNYEIEPRLRLSDKLSLIGTYSKNDFNDEIGWVNALDDGAIIFGRRDQNIHETILRTSYVFNDLMGLTFRLRHYWTTVRYKKYHELGAEGELLNTDYTGLNEEGVSAHDVNFNAFNIDLVYRWVFSPGSEVSIVWKNGIIGSEQELDRTFTDNFRRTLEFDQLNSVSIRVLYFLDYMSLRGKKRRRTGASISAPDYSQKGMGHRLNTRRVM